MAGGTGLGYANGQPKKLAVCAAGLEFRSLLRYAPCMFFDTHVHLDGFEDGQGVEDVLGRARQAGVDRMVAVGGSPRHNSFAVDCAARFAGSVHAAVGYDRDCAGTAAAEQALSGLDKAVAVGEIGLDFHYGPDKARVQQDLFADMLETACARCLPVIVHSREADEETVERLRGYAKAWHGRAGALGVLHCFTGSLDLARDVLSLGFHISFSGIITFRNAGPLREVARFVPDDRLLVETDAPLLAPEPYRGRRNEPAYIGRVADQLAEIRQTTVQEIAALTTVNAERLFDVRPPSAG